MRGQAMNQLSLKTKGSIIIIIICLVPLLSVGVYNYISLKQDMFQTEVDKHLLKQESISIVFQTWIATRVAEVTVMSRTDAVRSGDVDEMVVYLQKEHIGNQFYYDEIGFFDVNGTLTDLKGKRLTLQDKSLYQDALKGETIVSNPVKPTYSEYQLGYITVPVFDDIGTIIGAIYAAYKFPPKSYSDLLLNDNGSIYLYDRKGTQFYVDDKYTIAIEDQSIVYEEMGNVATTQAEHNDYQNYFIDRNNEYIIYHRQIDGTNWIMFEVENMSKLKALASPTLWRILITISLAVLFIAIIFYIYFDSIISRLKDILRVTSIAAQGTFETEHLNGYSGDEIGNLAKSINGMMGNIQVMFDRLNAVINQNKDPVIIMDERYIITYVNKAFEQMVGYKSEELVGKVTPLQFMDPNEVKQRAEALSQQLGRPIHAGVEVFLELRRLYPVYEFELTVYNRDGKRIPVYNHSSSLKSRNGKLSGIIAILNDMSQQKEMQTHRDRLQIIVESAMDLIASVNHHAKIIYLNEAGKKMLGIEREQWEGEPISKFLPDHLYHLLMRGTIKAKLSGYFETDAQFKNKEGKHVNVSIVIVAHKDAFTGELTYSCISRDITEQLEVQRQLVQATEAAEEASRAKSNFLALMSHEIRTPLNGIIGLTQLLNKTELDTIQSEYVHRMKDSSDMLLTIVTDILDFSKLEANKIEPDYSMFQPRSLINHLADQLSVFLGGKDELDFKIVFTGDIPQSMIGDSLRLEQVLSNLCVNAIKFTERGIIQLSVTIVSESHDGYDVQFTVSDTGIGMTQDQVKHLFQPFTQADSSTTRKYGGTGLGLVISKSLVNLLGGELYVESEFGKGSSFTFTIPFKKVANTRSTDQVAPINTVEQLVWIVENSEEMSAYWSELLSMHNYSSIRMKSWKHAYYRLMVLGEGAYPAFIMLDMEMHDMYGIETWLSFKEAARVRDIPIIVFTTAFGREELLVLEASQQPEQMLTKPVTPTRLEDAIRYITLEEQPVQQQQPATNEQAQQSSLPSTKVLLAEDNKVNQLVAVEMLKYCQCEVTVASTGLEAIDSLNKEHFDIVFMDIHMPEMDGVEAVKLIRSNVEYDDIPIIALTANTVKNDHVSYIDAGMNEVLTKPISIEDLEEVLTTYIHKQQPQASKLTAFAGKMEDEELLLRELSNYRSIQVEEALERLNGKLHIYMHMLKQYNEDYYNISEQLASLIENEQYTNAEKLLHTFKGASSYLAANELYQLAKQGEQIVKTKQFVEWTSFISRLHQEMSHFHVNIGKLLNKFNIF